MPIYVNSNRTIHGTRDVGDLTPIYTTHNSIVTLALYPMGNNARFEFSISPVDDVSHDIARWHPWTPGDIAIPTFEIVISPTAFRIVTTGLVEYEILGDVLTYEKLHERGTP